jgi:hypothetical protein
MHDPSLSTSLSSNAGYMYPGGTALFDTMLDIHDGHAFLHEGGVHPSMREGYSSTVLPGGSLSVPGGGAAGQLGVPADILPPEEHFYDLSYLNTPNPCIDALRRK